MRLPGRVAGGSPDAERAGGANATAVAKLQPAALAWRDGVPFNATYGDVYASRDGALGQARHVFLGGNALPARWAGREQFVILETGFGLGTSLLAAWQAWRDDPARPRKLHLVSVEMHPVDAAALCAAAAPELLPLAAQLAAQWPLPLPGLHVLAFEGGAVTLTLGFGDAATLVPQLALGADAIFLDGFAPDRNPAMWSPPLLKAVARLARPGCTLATWCTARAVREALTAGGFELELRPGFGRKRQMLAGRYAPRFTVRRHEPPAVYAGERHAIVIGAGLAGCNVAHALATRGWQVDLLEQGARVAAGASALPAGLLHPQFAADDSRLARLTRAGALSAVALLRRIDPQRRFARCEGLFQQAASDDELAAWRAALQAQPWPAAFIELLESDAAAARLGQQPQRGGLWFGPAGAVASAAWCEALCADAGAALRGHLQARVETVERDAQGWRVHFASSDGTRTLHAPVLVHAAALDAPRLAQSTHAPLRAVRGRLSMLPPAALSTLAAPISGDGYALQAPPVVDRALVGASYELLPPGITDPQDGAPADTLVHAGNLRRLQRLLPQARVADDTPHTLFDALRAVAPDRLPLAGALADEAAARAAAADLRGAHLPDLPRQPGAYACVGLASRGLTLAPLLAHLIAAQVEGTPWPVERDLAASVDPARFLLQALRR